MPPKEKKKGTKKKEEAKFGDIERTQCDQDNSVRNTSQYGTLSVYAAAPQQGKPAVNPNVYKGPNISMLKERIKSEGIPIISANTEKFNETELKTIEEFLIKRNGLRIGDTIESSTRRYKIGAVIGEGRYCDVYCGIEEKDNEEDDVKGKWYAIKIDKRKHEFRTRQKIEISVFDRIRVSTKMDASYRFPEYIESGISRGKPFIIMNVLGPNISKVREKVVKKGNNYERKSAYFLALETLRVLRDFHKLGFVHRDIKPMNFCIGHTRENYDKVYLIDFASAARLDDTNQLELLRMEKSYPLTNQNLVFCAPEAHRAELLTRRSDIISWFFMIVDIFDRDIIRWKKWEDSDKILEAKTGFFKDRATLLSPLPKVLQDMAGMIEDPEPKYDKMLYMLNDEKKELDQKFPMKKFEWMHLNF
ncbi:hypothetical protein PRIPAC_78643 [Pristionchus pacificus]|uniref:Protein kinase domain-containing protein n=1 Tax=Pristionchus pacificus TaxID=54126 RepID=A0A454XXD3_PRIPA|nr:hypothetical protein PRIPAC_78643 [Pristionchus pacificus]|eukprot:PDM75442.1 protein kinase [Pristionchus pacificus]